MIKEVVKPTKEQRRAIREARKLIQQVIDIDGNEAETRRRVEKIFESVMGYDAFKHLSRERAVSGPGETEHVDFAIQLEPSPDALPVVMIELKRVKVDLDKKHLKQVTSYAIDAGCNWVILTNGREWKVYHVEFGKPPEQKLLDVWNLMEDDIDVLHRKFEIISYKSVRKGGLETYWERIQALSPESLLKAIVNNDAFNVIRRNLWKETGIRVDKVEIYKGISKLLNEAAAKAMSKIKIPKSTKNKKERTSRQHEAEIQSDDDTNENDNED